MEEVHLPGHFTPVGMTMTTPPPLSPHRLPDCHAPLFGQGSKLKDEEHNLTTAMDIHFLQNLVFKFELMLKSQEIRIIDSVRDLFTSHIETKLNRSARHSFVVRHGSIDSTPGGSRRQSGVAIAKKTSEGRRTILQKARKQSTVSHHAIHTVAQRKSLAAIHHHHLLHGHSHHELMASREPSVNTNVPETSRDTAAQRKTLGTIHHNHQLHSHSHHELMASREPSVNTHVPETSRDTAAQRKTLGTIHHNHQLHSHNHHEVMVSREPSVLTNVPETSEDTVAEGRSLAAIHHNHQLHGHNRHEMMVSKEPSVLTNVPETSEAQLDDAQIHEMPPRLSLGQESVRQCWLNVSHVSSTATIDSRLDAQTHDTPAKQPSHEKIKFRDASLAEASVTSVAFAPQGSETSVVPTQGRLSIPAVRENSRSSSGAALSPTDSTSRANGSTRATSVREQILRLTKRSSDANGDLKADSVAKQLDELHQMKTNIAQSAGGGAKRNFFPSHSSQPEECEEHRVPSLTRFMTSRPVELTISIAIFVNAIVMGWQVDANMRGNSDLITMFRVFDVGFLVFFALELTLRVATERLTFLSCSNENLYWNIFDTILVVTSIIEEFFSQMINMTSNISVMRIFRMLRLIRIFRVIRVMRFFRDLRVIASGIVASLQSLVWAGLLLFVFMFLCAVCVLQFAVEEVQTRHDDPHSGTLSDVDFDKLRKYYDGLFTTMHTLYQSITGGINWGEAARPLMSLGTGLGMLYSFYIAFAVLCVLNIITGVFVENANKMTAQDQDMVMMEDIETRRKWLEEVKILFEAADVDGSGWLSKEEFSEQLKDIKMQSWLRKIGVRVESYSAGSLFQLLDFDGDGMLDMDEFAIALQQVHGAARSIDVAKVLHDTKTLRKHLDTLSELCFWVFEELSPGCVEECFDELNEEYEQGVSNRDT